MTSKSHFFAIRTHPKMKQTSAPSKKSVFFEFCPILKPTQAQLGANLSSNIVPQTLLLLKASQDPSYVRKHLQDIHVSIRNGKRVNVGESYATNLRILIYEFENLVFESSNWCSCYCCCRCACNRSCCSCPCCKRVSSEESLARYVYPPPFGSRP